MTFTSRDTISVVDLIVYFPTAITASILCSRHGWGPNNGWLFLLIFSLLRLVGASETLATIYHPTNIPLQTSAVLLSTIGLSPLLFCTLGLLIRVNRSIRKSHETKIKTIAIRWLRMPIIAAMTLVIIGGTDSSSKLVHTGVYPISVWTKIGIPILIATFVIVCCIAIWLLLHTRYAEKGEKRLGAAIAASLPLLALRLIYATLVTFSRSRTFGLLGGSVVAYGCMAVLMEMLVVIIYGAVGLTLPKFVPLPREGENKESFSNRLKGKFTRGGERIANGWTRLTVGNRRESTHQWPKPAVVDLEGGKGPQFEATARETIR